MPGIPGPNPAIADFDIVQTIVYNAALSDAQVEGVNEWLSNNLTGGSGTDANELRFTKIELSPDLTSVTLTWQSKPGRTYAVDLSGDLTSPWQELNDEIPSEGTETSTTVPTFAGPQPDPLRERVFYQVREVPAG